MRRPLAAASPERPMEMRAPAATDLDELPEPLDPPPGAELPSVALERLRRDER